MGSANNLMTASVELMRCGDVAVTTNGVAALLPRELPFAHDGFGQDAKWVAANFTNATEIAAAGGYAAWLDAQVGGGLTNGLYKLTVTVAEEPLETMQIAATVEATATNGEVVVEARFNADAIQPRFVLPVVPMRQIPIVLRSKGGKTVPENLQMLCSRCNSIKSGK